MVGCAIGCFGKLPVHQDFIRMNATVPEMEQLDRWYQEGIQVAKRRADMNWPEDFEKAEPWEFVFQQEAARRYVVGVCVPSRDEGGRHYPFFVFLLVEGLRSGVPAFLAPTGFAGFLKKARLLARTDWGTLSLPQLRDRIEQMGVVDWSAITRSKDSYQDFLRTRTTGEFWMELFGECESSRKYLLYRTLSYILEPLRDNPVNHLAAGLAFPILADDREANLDIAFWLDLMRRILKQDREEFAFFWNRETAHMAPRLVVHLSAPTAKTALFLIRPDRNADAICDLAPEERASLEWARLQIGSSRRKLLQNRDLSLAVFLEAAGALG